MSKAYYWEVIKCPRCDKVYAIPVYNFHQEYKDTASRFHCCYCKQDISMYDAIQGGMIADRGLIVETVMILTDKIE